MIAEMGNSLGKAAAIDFGIQWACWAVAAVLQTEKFYDLAGSGTFIYLALKSLAWNNTYHLRQKLQTGMVISWAASTSASSVTNSVYYGDNFFYLHNAGGLRIPMSLMALLAETYKGLGLFLFTRILKEGQDRRFNNVRNKPGLFFVYWTVQGVWVFLTILPTLIVNSKKEDRPLTKRDYVGYGLWTVGFILEVLADYQKSSFRANPDNQGKFINQGLWSVVQYPNYLGEILMWSGIYLSSTSVLKGWEHISVISPLFLTYLLTNISGIPLQQRSAIKKFGINPDFHEYLRKTPKLLPFIW